MAKGYNGSAVLTQHSAGVSNCPHTRIRWTEFSFNRSTAPCLLRPLVLREPCVHTSGKGSSRNPVPSAKWKARCSRKMTRPLTTRRGFPILQKTNARRSRRGRSSAMRSFRLDMDGGCKCKCSVPNTVQNYCNLAGNWPIQSTQITGAPEEKVAPLKLFLLNHAHLTQVTLSLSPQI